MLGCVAWSLALHIILLLLLSENIYSLAVIIMTYMKFISAVVFDDGN